MNPSVNYGLWGNNGMFMNDDEPVGPFPVVSVSMLRGKCITVAWQVNSGGGCASVGAGELGDSVLSTRLH